MSRDLEDFEIKSKVRAMLVRYWFDTADLSIGVHHGNVNIIGSLRETSNLAEVEGVKTSSEVGSYEMDASGEMKEVSSHTKVNEKENIMDSITRRMNLIEMGIIELNGVRSVNFEFNNFLQKGKNWVRK